MTGLREDRSAPAAAAAGVCRFLARYGLALLLAGYLLFAHGCHGDEDNELFTAAATCVVSGE